MIQKVNIAGSLAQVRQYWRPGIAAQVNGQEVRLAKLHGEFIWHSHAEADELFMVVSGRLTIQTRDGDLRLGPGEMAVVPRGVEHRPVAPEPVHLLMITAAGTRNTGQHQDARLTAPAGVRI
ncbi:MAG: hypothetical protein C0475_05450 [Planctomyces sp.]|nr:hypothetical protein [Planctomyces sp.]MBA4039169.1 hypothetical protein [Planctomyces sp.]MBA4119310.1 hypothetical protein [Isosphaera sp.]